MIAKVRNNLIVSASVGAGHNQAARAIRDEFGERNPSAKSVIIDFMAAENSYINTFLKEAYLKMIDLTPEVYDILYRWSQVSGHGSRVQYIMARTWQKSMLRLLAYHRPDLVVSTHPFPSGAAAFLRRTGKTTIPLVTVITDFIAHRMWVNEETDLYCVACEETRRQLMAYGIPRNRIYVTGIPISRQFRQPVNRDAIRQTLNLLNDRPVILIMGGGLGLGPAGQAFAALNSCRLPLNIIVVTGENFELRDSLQAAADTVRHKIHILGYTTRIGELMAASDLLITKPGALTISEALAMELPMLFYNPIPGQEEDNAALVSNKGAALWVKNDQDLTGTIIRLLTEPEQLTRLKRNARQIRRPDAAVLAVDAIDYGLSGRISTVSGV